MEFSSHQKKIIQFIRDGKVKDISSYLEAFQYTMSYSKESVKKTITLGEKTFEFNFTEPQTISRDLSGIYDLLFVWQYLRESGLLLELEKAPTPQDLSVFFTLQKDADEGILFNKELFKICRGKILLTILPAPGIGLFIKRNYKTMGELFAKNSLKVAWAAVTISLIFLIGTIVAGVFFYYDAKREASFLMNQTGALQSEANAINKNVSQIKDTISGISDKINSFLPK
jgi:hypothetical protein